MNDIYGSIFLSEFKVEITDAAFKVYAYLRVRQNTGEECWPSLNTISKDTGKSVKTVTRALKQLESKDLITVKRTRIAKGMNEVNRYKCNIRTAAVKDTTGNMSKGLLSNCHNGTEKLSDKNKHIKQTIENNSVDELKAYSKAKGGLMIIHKNRIAEMLKDFTVEQLKRAIDSGTKWAEKNEVGRKNLSRSIVEHSIKNSKPKVAKYMTSDEYKKKFPGKRPVKKDKELWF